MFSELMGLRHGRLRLTPAHPEDAERILALLDQKTVKNFSFFAKPVGLEDERKYLRRMEVSPTDHVYLLEEIERTAPEERRLIGTIGFHELDDVNKSARLGCIIFRPEDRGRGRGTEAIELMLLLAFSRLNLHKVHVQFFANHGKKVYDYWARLGFEIEGTLREEYLLDGTWVDMVRFSILKREWETRRQVK